MQVLLNSNMPRCLWNYIGNIIKFTIFNHSRTKESLYKEITNSNLYSAILKIKWYSVFLLSLHVIYPILYCNFRGKSVKCIPIFLVVLVRIDINCLRVIEEARF